MTSAGDDLAPLKKALGDLLAARRVAVGLTQRQLAQAISYGRTTVATAESGHRQPAAGFWTNCDEILGAGGDLTRAYEQLAAARRRRVEQRVQAARFRRGTQPEVNPSAVVGLRNGTAMAESSDTDSRRPVSGGAGAVLATVAATDSRAIGAAATLRPASPREAARRRSKRLLWLVAGSSTGP